ncbi:hypothetical protein [Paenibacillus thermotolerans]|uniref:hypothetical protein n=1 Tax=Paenibacillus thermotolerans TaxID=3027807 RepID=UPI0023684EDC|nr:MULTISPECIES: hypothetical protein [unclassified Paenibacillus]
MTNEIGYRAGDILTACDNEFDVPPGYIGHAAIVADNRYMIEAVITYPYVQASTIDSFLTVHPKHAVYRPVDAKMGASAANFAVKYFLQCDANYRSGIAIPKFSFSPQIPLADPWSSIYCSKLVWLSYYYGAGYPFYNDYYLFTPEDLDAVCSKDPHFESVYKHPNFQFLVDT